MRAWHACLRARALPAIPALSIVESVGSTIPACRNVVMMCMAIGIPLSVAVAATSPASIIIGISPRSAARMPIIWAISRA